MGKWIRVEERMPDDDLSVLVFAPKSSEPVWPAYWDGDVESWSWAESQQEVYPPPTHWMRLPEAPENDWDSALE